VLCSLISILYSFILKSVVLVVLFGCKFWYPTCRPLRVCGNRVLWKICEPKREKVTGYWRKLHSNSFMICIPAHILLLLLLSSSASSLIRLAGSRRVRWAGHMARIWEKKKCIQGCDGKMQRVENTLEDLGMDGRIILTVSRVTHRSDCI